MFNWIIKKIIGSKNQRTIKRLQPLVAEINRFEQQLQNEPVEALRERTARWKDQFKAFHTPPFLSGVPLRIADDEQVNECLGAVAETFDRLKVHFASLDGYHLRQAVTGSMSIDEKKALIAEAQKQWEEVKPKFTVIEQKML